MRKTIAAVLTCLFLLPAAVYAASPAPVMKVITFERVPGAAADTFVCAVEVTDDVTGEVLFAPSIQFSGGEHATATLEVANGTTWIATVSVDAAMTTGLLELKGFANGETFYSVNSRTTVKTK